MRAALFGSTGRVGSLMLQQLLEDGHDVTALVRDPAKLPVHPQLTAVTGDAKDGLAVRAAIEGADCVASALGTDGTTTLREAVPHMVDAMETLNIRRIVTIGTAGILQSRLEPDLLRYQAGDSARKLTRAAEEHHAAYDALAGSDLEWTIVCPTYLPDGPAAGTYRVEADRLPEDGKQISTADTALFAVRELMDRRYIRHRVGIAY